MKTVKINNWAITGSVSAYTPPEYRKIRLHGDFVGHPKLGDRKDQITSSIQKVEGRKIHTRNNIYILGKIDPGYRKWLRNERPNWNWRKPITVISS